MSASPLSPHAFPPSPRHPRLPAPRPLQRCALRDPPTTALALHLSSFSDALLDPPLPRASPLLPVSLPYLFSPRDLLPADG